MSTYCALHIQTTDKQSIVSLVEKFLASNHGRRVAVATDSDALESIYGDEFICSDDKPTKFAVDTGTAGWFVAHFNSFNPVRDLAADISRSLKTLVVVVLAQSASSAYQIEVWRAGENLRTLYFAGDWIANEGTPLPFESSSLGTDVSEEGEEPCYIFGRSDTIEYCSHLGLRLWQRASVPVQWSTLNV